MSENSTISHKIIVGDQSFNVRIKAEDRPKYDRAARFVQETLSDIRGQGFGTAGPQVWAMTAFQIALELFEAQELADGGAGDQERIKKMLDRIEKVMPRESPLSGN